MRFTYSLESRAKLDVNATLAEGGGVVPLFTYFLSGGVEWDVRGIFAGERVVPSTYFL